MCSVWVFFLRVFLFLFGFVCQFSVVLQLYRGLSVVQYSCCRDVFSFFILLRFSSVLPFAWCVRMIFSINNKLDCHLDRCYPWLERLRFVTPMLQFMRWLNPYKELWEIAWECKHKHTIKYTKRKQQQQQPQKVKIPRICSWHMPKCRWFNAVQCSSFLCCFYGSCDLMACHMLVETQVFTLLDGHLCFVAGFFFVIIFVFCLLFASFCYCCCILLKIKIIQQYWQE